VESGSAAETAGLQAGDCVLEVNGEDVLGQRIGDVASKVRARGDRVTLLLWNAGSDPHTAASSVSAGLVIMEINLALVSGIANADHASLRMELARRDEMSFSNYLTMPYKLVSAKRICLLLRSPGI
jgi:hypothetical protein